MDAAGLIGLIEIGLSFVVSAVFIVLYSIQNRWWNNPTGRGFMAMMVVIAAVLGLSLVRWLFIQPEPSAPVCTGQDSADWFTWLRVAVFGLVPIALAWPIRAYIGVLNERRRHGR